MPDVCRQCGAAVAQAERDAGRCARCGAALNERITVQESDPTATLAHLDPVVPPPPPAKAPTIDKIGADRTIDFGTADDLVVEPPQPESKPGTVYPLPHMQTLDLPADGDGSDDFVIEPPTKEPKPGTVHPLPHMQTIDLPSDGASDDLNLSQNLQAPSGSGSASPEQSGFSDTFDSKASGMDLNEQLSVAWGDQVDDDVSPRFTVKGRTKTGGKNDQTLVVNVRSVRDATRPTTAAPLADYELLEILGEGGMGVVYTARQASIDRTVAVKMLKPKLAGSRDSQQKFLSEAVVTGDLDHPNIVPMYDLGKNSAGDLFYAMKRVEGTPWSKVVDVRTRQENVEILLKVADAVAFAHARGVVHRDLKPENVMLGEFGEVLVMDWGLAYSTPAFRKSASITHTHSMGGSPAYMAPEMATGPVDHITTAADVYLLGAILYEIVTGRPPHSGANVTKCLMAAARNEILPTEMTGELIDIAYRAMATKPADRYPSVRAFQTAIREYMAHAESIALTARAGEDLTQARASSAYPTYARAVFGFEQAVDLWNGNTEAVEGLASAKSAYAACAFGRGDFDLAAGLLDRARPDQAALLDQIEAARQERDARQLRLRRAKRFVASLLVGIFVVGTAAFFGIRAQRDRALRAEEQARHDRDLAEKSEEQARHDRDLAEQSKEAEEYAAYAARIGLAAARIDENAFDGAAELLDTCPVDLRNWEWGRLKYLCERSRLTINVGAPVNAVALDATGKRCASGGWNGKLQIWNVEDGALLIDVPYDGAFVNAVAFSPDGRYLAAGGSDKRAYVQLYDVADGKPAKSIAGHTDAVLSLVFNRRGDRLLTTSYDGTVRLWDVTSGAELQSFRGHASGVTSAAFTSDEKTLVTTGHDGTAIVWPLGNDGATRSQAVDAPVEVRAFLGHRGPIHGAACSPDGLTAATAGDDHRVLLWNPADVRPYRLAEVFSEQPPPPPPFRELLGHRAAVVCTAYSPDGRRLVSGGLDNALIVWDAASGEPLKTLRGHAGQVRACCFSADGRRVVSAAHDGTVRVWDVDEYEETRIVKPIVLAGHADAVEDADFSPDEQTIVTADRDRIAMVWNARTLQQTAKLAEGHEYLASTAQLTTDGKRLITSAVDGTTRVWDVSSGVEIAVVVDTGRSAAAAVSPDGRLVLSGDGEQGAKLWETDTGRLVRALPAHRAELTAVAFSADGKLCCTGESSGRVNVWRTDDGTLLWSELHHSRKITGVAFTADGKQLLTASLDNTVGRWDVAAGRELTKLVWKHPAGVVGLALVGPERTVTACEDGLVRMWNLAAESPTADVLPLPKAAYSTVASSSDGKRLAVVDRDNGAVRLWNVAASSEHITTEAKRPSGAWLDLAAGGTIWTAVFVPDGASLVTVGGNEAQQWNLADAAEMQTFRPHGPLAGVAVSPDGKHTATAGWDGTVKIWNLAAARAVMKIVAHSRRNVNDVAYRGDGRMLLTAGDDRTARLWNVETGEEVRAFTGHADRVLQAAFSTDGKRIVTASADKTARIWNAADGTLLHELAGHAWAVLSAEFSADGRWVVTAGADDVATLWDAETGQPIHSFTGHTAPVTSASFSPDALRVVTGSRDANVKLWDRANGKELLTLKGHAGEVTVAKFSASGRSILTAAADGAAILWPTLDWKAANDQQRASVP